MLGEWNTDRFTISILLIFFMWNITTVQTPMDEHQFVSVASCYTVLQEEVPSIVDCPDPDHMTPHERRVARIAHEEASFDAEYYLYVTSTTCDSLPNGISEARKLTCNKFLCCNWQGRPNGQ